MKRVISILLIMIPLMVFGQKDVTTFLGIPVDGRKTNFIQCLKKKGFVLDYHSDNGTLYGKFNGNDVVVYIQTNNDKVCRIIVSDKNETRNETDIKIKFNKLIHQFQNNEKYTEYPLPNEEISEDTDLSHEISVKNKRFQAEFYQRALEVDSIDSEKLSDIQKRIEEAQSAKNTTAALEIFGELDSFYRKYLKNKLVWFMINENYGRYSISIFYENGYNMANGEDL